MLNIHHLGRHRETETQTSLILLVAETLESGVVKLNTSLLQLFLFCGLKTDLRWVKFTIFIPCYLDCL